MNSKNEMQERLSAEFEPDNGASIDDFLKELEEKEKDLNISTEMVIEVDEIDGSDASFSEEDFPDYLDEKFAEIKTPEKKSVPKAATPEAEKNTGTEISRLRQQIGNLENECKELKTTLQRRQNDFDSYRKRIERERGESFLDQVGNLATQLLPVLDNLNRALDAAMNLSGDQSKNFQNLFDGIVLVNQQLNEVLSEMGIEPIASVGERFDPHFHDAVAAEESKTYSPNTVTAEFLRGYRVGDKVIRPAMVKVASQSSSIYVSSSEADE